MSQRICLLVEIDVEHTGAFNADEAAEVVEQVIETAIDNGILDYLHSGGPAPPYNGRPRLMAVSTEVL